MSCPIDIEYICGLRERDKRQLRQTLHEREELATLGRRVERVDKNEVYRRNRTWFELQKIDSPCCVCKTI